MNKVLLGDTTKDYFIASHSYAKSKTDSRIIDLEFDELRITLKQRKDSFKISADNLNLDTGLWDIQMLISCPYVSFNVTLFGVFCKPDGTIEWIGGQYKRHLSMIKVEKLNE